MKRRLAELVDPDGALVLNADDPVSLAYAGLGAAPTVLYRRERPLPGGLGVVDGWIVAAGVERCPWPAAGRRGRPRGRIMPLAELALPGRHNVSNALAAVAVALLFGLAPDAIRRAVAGVHRRRAPPRAGRRDRRRALRQRLPGDPARRRDRRPASFQAPLVLIAGGRDKGVDLSELARVAAERAAAVVLIGESGPPWRARSAAGRPPPRRARRRPGGRA